jgi:hypothetical protein
MHLCAQLSRTHLHPWSCRRCASPSQECRVLVPGGHLAPGVAVLGGVIVEGGYESIPALMPRRERKCTCWCQHWFGVCVMPGKGQPAGTSRPHACARSSRTRTVIHTRTRSGAGRALGQRGDAVVGQDVVEEEGQQALCDFRGLLQAALHRGQHQRQLPRLTVPRDKSVMHLRPLGVHHRASGAAACQHSLQHARA